MNRCIRCGNLTEKERFCSRACANTRVYDAKKKEEVYHKVSQSLTRIKIAISKNCEICGNEFVVSRRSMRKKCCSTSCSAKLSTLNGLEKLRASAIQRHRNKETKFGWQIRDLEYSSYPEKYFESVFDNAKLEYSRELRVGKWFLDFAFISVKLAIEIDGKQHSLPERKNKDILKDEYLASQGWKVIRFNWDNPRTEDFDKRVSLLLAQIIVFLG